MIVSIDLICWVFWVFELVLKFESHLILKSESESESESELI